MDYAHLDFSEGTNKFKQELTTSGTGWNIGFQWQATPALASVRFITPKPT